MLMCVTGWGPENWGPCLGADPLLSGDDDLRSILISNSLSFSWVFLTCLTRDALSAKERSQSGPQFSGPQPVTHINIHNYSNPPTMDLDEELDLGNTIPNKSISLAPMNVTVINNNYTTNNYNNYTSNYNFMELDEALVQTLLDSEPQVSTVAKPNEPQVAKNAPKQMPPFIPSPSNFHDVLPFRQSALF